MGMGVTNFVMSSSSLTVISLYRILVERDELKCRFTRAVLEVQERAALKSALLETKLKNLEGRDLGPTEMNVSLLDSGKEQLKKRVFGKIMEMKSIDKTNGSVL